MKSGVENGKWGKDDLQTLLKFVNRGKNG